VLCGTQPHNLKRGAVVIFTIKKMEHTSPHRRGMLMRPGLRAFTSGLAHSMLAAGVKRVIIPNDFSPNKKQKTQMTDGYKKTGVKKTSYKRTNKKTASVVKDTILGMAATYHKTQSDATLFVDPMTHNTIYTYNVTAQVVPGTTVGTRQGDSIFLKGLNVKGNLLTNDVSNGYQYRVMVLMSGEEYDAGSSFGIGVNGLGLGEIFYLPQAFIGTSAIVNPKAVTILHDEIIDINSQVSNIRDIANCSFYVSLNRKFHYQSSGGVYG